jgi:hypothetical protein
MACWELYEYTNWVETGCPIDTSVRTLLLTKTKVNVTDKICNLKNLRILELNGNELTSFPESIGELQELTNLGLANNNLEMLPVEIGKLKELRVFNVSQNKLSKIPVFKELNNLQIIDLSHNDFVKFPNVFLMQNLHTLLLDHNKISKIPNEISKLISLRIFEMSNNNLQGIPSSIVDIKLLRGLNVSCNKIHKIPAILGIMNRVYFYYCENPILYVPPNVKRMSDLKTPRVGYVENSTKFKIIKLINCVPEITSEHICNCILMDPILSDQAKDAIISFSENENVLDTVNVTFLDILTAVWNKMIVKTVYSTDDEIVIKIKQLMNIEMLNPDCKSSLDNQITRLVNCLDIWYKKYD